MSDPIGVRQAAKAPPSKPKMQTVYQISQKLLTQRLKSGVNASNFTFVMMGDNRNVKSREYIFRQVWSKALSAVTYKNRNLPYPVFFLNGGDIVQSGTAANLIHFRHLIGLDTSSKLKEPLFITPGNHDRLPPSAGNTITNFTKYIGPKHFVLRIPKLKMNVVSIDSSPWFVDPKTGVTYWEMPKSETDYLRSQASKLPKSQLLFVMTHTPPAAGVFLKMEPSHVLNFDNDSNRFLSTLKSIRKKGYTIGMVLVSHIHCHATDTIQGIRFLLTGGAGAPGTCQNLYHFYIIPVVKGKVQTPILVPVKIVPPGKSKAVEEE